MELEYAAIVLLGPLCAALFALVERLNRPKDP